jgi:hypothetical protein
MNKISILNSLVVYNFYWLDTFCLEQKSQDRESAGGESSYSQSIPSPGPS